MPARLHAEHAMIVLKCMHHAAKQLIEKATCRF